MIMNPRIYIYIAGFFRAHSIILEMQYLNSQGFAIRVANASEPLRPFRELIIIYNYNSNVFFAWWYLPDSLRSLRCSNRAEGKRNVKTYKNIKNSEVPSVQARNCGNVLSHHCQVAGSSSANAPGMAKGSKFEWYKCMHGCFMRYIQF